MQTGGKDEQGSDVNSVIGVSLVADVESTRTTNIGVCLVPCGKLNSWTVAKLRKAIINDIIACPPDFQICTKQGWPLTDVQEHQLSAQHILNDNHEVLIKVKHDKPKCGIKDWHGHVIGFVHISYAAVLSALKNLIQSQILKQEDISKDFQFLDGNSWPISSVQERHMTVSDILIENCVSTNLQSASQSQTLSPPKEPPLKKLKGAKDLSFRSGKDVHRQLDCDVTDGDTKPKQVLISYVRSEAADHALRLKHQLTALGLSVYLDVHEIQTGVDWQDSLNFAVSGCEVFVPLVTLKYGETQWTNREVKLADVLGKYILPVNFLPDWPPRCLAIQFATTQFIPWLPLDSIPEKNQAETEKCEWTAHDIQIVAQKIANRIRGLGVKTVPSLVKRATIVKSCACVTEDNMMAITSDRAGKPLIMICVHHTQQTYGAELQSLLEEEGFEVWCTTELDKEHIDHIDGLASSQDDITYSILNNGDDTISGCPRNSIVRNIEIFQEKADDASLVLFVLSDAFSNSRVCQQQVFYCEHRKHVIPILYEDFKMPDWMSMLVGSHGFEMKKDEDFIKILIRRITATISSAKHTLNPRSLVRTGTRIGAQSMLGTMVTNSLSSYGTRVPVVRNGSNTENLNMGTLHVKKSFVSNHDSQNGDHSLDTCGTVTGSTNGTSSNQTAESYQMDTGITEDRPSLTSMNTVIL